MSILMIFLFTARLGINDQRAGFLHLGKKIQKTICGVVKLEKCTKIERLMTVRIVKNELGMRGLRRLVTEILVVHEGSVRALIRILLK